MPRPCEVGAAVMFNRLSQLPHLTKEGGRRKEDGRKKKDGGSRQTEEGGRGKNLYIREERRED